MKRPKSLSRIFIILLFILSTKAHSNESSSSIWTQILHTFVEGVGSVNIESASLGMDSGLIHQIIIGSGRTVERNPFATDSSNQFLVKDRLRLGIELGAGFVLAGTATYVQEWTLVYPVSKAIDGHLSKKFIVDLFLPISVSQWEESQLPRDYTVIREAYIEGKGRVKFGNLPLFSLGSESSFGRVNFLKTMARRYQNDHLKMMMEKGAYQKLANEIWLNLGALNIPVFDSLYGLGSSRRTFYSMDQKDWRNLPKEKLYSALFKGLLNKQSIRFKNKELAIESAHELNQLLLPYQENEIWDTQYKETKTSFSLFWLYNRDTYQRMDSIDYYKDNEYEQWWQWEDRRNFDWTNGIRGEVYQSQILLSGKREGFDIIDPILSLNLSIDDGETTIKEYQDNYLVLTKELTPGALANKTFQETMVKLQCESCFPDINSIQRIKLFYEEEHLLTFLQATPEAWQQAIEEVTNEKWSYIERSMQTQFHDRNRRRLRQSRIPLKDIRLGRSIEAFLKIMSKAQLAYQDGNKILAYRHLGWAFRSSFYMNNLKGHNIILLKAMNQLLVNKKSSPYHQWNHHKLYYQNSVLAEATYQNHESVLERMNQTHFAYILEDPSEIFYFFDLKP